MAYAVNAQGIVDNVFGGAGKVNRGVTAGHAGRRTTRSSSTTTRPRPRSLLDSSAWDKTKPLRIVFDKSFAGVEQWVPVFAQDLEAIGFTTELNGLETTAAIEFYNKIDSWEIIIAQGGDQGVGPFRTQELLQLQADRAGRQPGVLQGLQHRRALPRQARRELDETKREPRSSSRSRGIMNKAVDPDQLLDDQCAERQVRRRLEGLNIPPNTREYHRRGLELDLHRRSASRSRTVAATIRPDIDRACPPVSPATPEERPVGTYHRSAASSSRSRSCSGSRSSASWRCRWRRATRCWHAWRRPSSRRSSATRRCSRSGARSSGSTSPSRSATSSGSAAAVTGDFGYLDPVAPADRRGDRETDPTDAGPHGHGDPDRDHARRCPLGIISALRQYSKTDYVLTGDHDADEQHARVRAGPRQPSTSSPSGWTSSPAGASRPSGRRTRSRDFLAHMTCRRWCSGWPAPPRSCATRGRACSSSSTVTTSRRRKAKGLSHRTVVVTHAFRNSLIPIITVDRAAAARAGGRRRHHRADLRLARHGPAGRPCRSRPRPGADDGRRPGRRDAVLITNILVDVLYARVDPRIRFGRGN